jgi:hypothetical protein
MKKNINETIGKLEKIYFEIPDDFALQNARMFFRKAINEMKEIQNKRERREKTQQNIPQTNSSMDAQSAKLALKELDRLIAMENKKLEKPEKKANYDSSDDQFLIG